MAGFPPSIHNLNNQSLHSLHLSPGSSPTAPDFPSHTHTPHSLSRQHSFQHIPEYPPPGSMHGQPHGHLVSNARYEPAMTPLPPSPGPNSGPMDFDDSQGRKRQRTAGGDDHVVGGKNVKGGSRARSDSAPLGGYGLAPGSWGAQTRPRSGSGLQSRATTGRRDELPVPNIGTLSRVHQHPMLAIPNGKQSAS